ncbi:Lrp/AsnC family transcriptional regulator [Stackebrandtia sp.]|uniref:Lrp/AsnC family transcriptional regulator n=1 Tax=Stackebrandtia sp. TaxID=2023065 RepID=UPI0032C23261
MVESIDDLDRQLVHALQINGRASFARIGEVLAVSDQTVARRYRRLRSRGIVRVVAQTDQHVLKQERWMVRIHCNPDAAASLAAALARRRDTAWISLVSGGTEINFVVQTRDTAARDTLLLEKLPHTPRVNAISAHLLVHTFFGGAGEHVGLMSVLDDGQVAALAPPAVDRRPIAWDDTDRALYSELALDGRAEYPRLAAAAGCSESTAKRRVEAMLHSGSLIMDVDIDAAAFGLTVTAALWMSVSPSQLSAVGAALATHREIGFAAATTGPSNLIAAVVCRDVHDLYEYVSSRLGALPAVQRVETAPIIRSVKGPSVRAVPAPAPAAGHRA